MEAKRFPCTNKECTNTVSLRYAYEFGGMCPKCTIKNMVDSRTRDQQESDRHRVENPQG